MADLPWYAWSVPPAKKGFMADWSPSPQDGYIEHLERVIIELQKPPAVKVVNAKNGDLLTVVQVTRTPIGIVVEVEV